MNGRAAVPILLKAVISADKVVAQAAGSALAVIESPEVDRAIVGMLRDDHPQTRLVATALAGKRHIAAATPILLEFAQGSDPVQRQAAILALGSTAELNDLPQLIEMVAKIRQSGDQAVLREALKAACSRLPQAAAAEVLAASIPGKPPEVKVALLEPLAAIGGATALDTVVAAARHGCCTPGRCNAVAWAWMTPDVVPALRDLAESLDNAKYRTRAIRGYIRVARQMDMTSAERLEMCRNALALAERVEEKKLVLDAVARMDSTEALQLAADQLTLVELLPEASHSVVAVADRVLAAAPLAVEEALQRVVLLSTSRETATRARTLLARAREKTEAGFISLFDGESLQGWEGNFDMFRVVDGAIVGGSLDKDVPRNEFLCTTQMYADFELRLQFKIIGDKANAGVQLRSRRIPGHHEMIGYQADLGDGWWGCLYRITTAEGTGRTGGVPPI